MVSTAPQLGEQVAVELMNTIWADRHGVHDALATPEQARAWLRLITPRLEAVAPEPAPTTGSVAMGQRLRTLRDALRRLAAETTGDRRPAAVSATTDVHTALAQLNTAAAAAPMWSSLRWSDDSAAVPTRLLHGDAGADAVLLSQLAEQGIELFTGIAGQDLRACLAPGCVLYFVKNHPRREWCSAGCGNRARVARHYHRHQVKAE